MLILSIDVGIKNLAMCLIRDKHAILQWEVDSVPSEHSDGLFKCMKSHLDERMWVLDADIVLIERQPDRNRKMKTIENFLHAYFVMHDKNTLLWDAKYKIPDVVGPGKKKYKLRKDTSIERCHSFIKESNPEWVSFFETHKKKDDLADTVMQALSYKTCTPNHEKITPRKPTEHQTNTKYSKSNLAWLYKHNKHINNKRFDTDLKRYFKNIDDFKAFCKH